MYLLLWIIAVIVGLMGLRQIIVEDNWPVGILLILLAFLIGPGGVSFWNLS